MNLKDFSTLQLALGASVLVHAALLAVRFVDPESFNRVFSETPLEVILVNAGANEKPDKAQAIAQRSLAGGGDLDKGARPVRCRPRLLPPPAIPPKKCSDNSWTPCRRSK